MIFGNPPTHKDQVVRRPFVIVILFLLIVLITAFTADHFYRNYLHDHWQTVSLNEEQEITAKLHSKLEFFQRETLESIEGVSKLSALQSTLAKRDTLSLIICFELLKRYAKPDLSMELYDIHKRLISWSGNRGPLVDTSQIKINENVFALQGPIYTYFMFSSPIIFGKNICGYIVGKRLFDVNYPINNRFINNNAFAGTFPRRLDFSPKFDFSSDAESSRDGRILSMELLGFNGTKLGYAYLQRPMLSAYVEGAHNFLLSGINIILIILLLIVLIRMYSLTGAKANRIVHILLSTISIWLFRYALVWADLPSSIFSESIFDPAYFASPFGFGIAKSVGDVLISSLLLLANVGIVVFPLFKELQRGEWTTQFTSFWKKVVAIGFVPVLALMFFLLMRGYSATIHSAVFDSSLGYNDPSSMIPSLELAVMFLSLLLIGISLVLVVISIISISFRLIQRSFKTTSGNPTPWIFLILMFSVVSILFGVLQLNPLMSQPERLLFLAGLIALTSWTTKNKVISGVFFHPSHVLVLIGAAIIILVPQLDRKAHELDRVHVELVAGDIVRPTDTWLALIVNKALDELSNEQAASILLNGDPDDIDRLAFTQWAKSVLSKEGFNCSVTIVDTLGKVISDFHIGIGPHGYLQHPVSSAPASRSISTEEKAQSGLVARWYTGYTPIFSVKRSQIGGVWLELSANKQTMLRGDAPEMLRNYQRENFETHFRHLVLSEYFQGKLAYTTDDNIPLDRPLPVSMQRIKSSGGWLVDTIDAKRYETFYVLEQSGGMSETWLALSMESLDFRWHVYSFTRYIVFYLVLAIGFVLAILTIRYMRGEKMAIGLGQKLMVAFMIVSLIPVLILAYYNRQYTIERVEEATIRRLSDQTSTVVAELQKQLGITVPYALSQLTDGQCEDIAGDLGTDFHVYEGTALQATSKPELFTAELIDQNLSADAYRNLMLRRKGFYSENQVIGKFPYIVGYRPLVAEDGNVIGVVSVPSLFRQAMINEELAKRNAFLFGAYVIAMIFSFVVGTIFAKQIALPVRRLKEATVKIAAGELDVNLNPAREGELGELEQAFSKMAKDLKQAQEQMVKAQRELAWKEMAKQVAHEIKNPLTPMKLSIQHLRQAYKDGARNFEAMLDQISSTVLDQIETLSRIASEFSHFGRMPERKLEIFNVHDVLREAANLFQQHTAIEFSFQLKAVEPLIHADREELRRAVVNIIRNSVQAMNEQGKITIVTATSNGYVEIQIIDNGPGIPGELHERLFEPNFSTKTDGMGLGLALVRNTIGDLGGTIRIDSVVDKGTTVIIRLPIRNEEAV
jgi:signal transduction histidine kinase